MYAHINVYTFYLCSLLGRDIALIMVQICRKESILLLMFTLFVTEYFLIWLQPLELAYLYLLQNIIYVHALFFISKGSRKCLITISCSVLNFGSETNLVIFLDSLFISIPYLSLK